ncbi:MAG: cob(I)yrinic acid a,c-diamide adenosyltransferase [Myxococcota bacterium]
MKVYTRGGDGGETSLFGGRRVSKDATRVEAYGCVDEVNALLGVALTEVGEDDLRELLESIQRSLFDLGGELATPDVEDRAKAGKAPPRVSDADVLELERAIDRLDVELEPLRAFVLPGGARGAALLHHARTVCRRAERRVVRLSQTETVGTPVIRYLNRLSDFLFVVARVVNRRASVNEPTWEGKRR